MGLSRIKRKLEKRDYRKLLRLFIYFSTTILKFLGIVVSTYNYRFCGKNGPLGTGVPGSGENTGPGSVQSAGCGTNKLNKHNVNVTTLKHFNANSTGTFELKSNKYIGFCAGKLQYIERTVDEKIPKSSANDVTFLGCFFRVKITDRISKTFQWKLNHNV